MNELVNELEKLVDIYAQMHTVSTGEADRDAGYNEAFDIVISDLRSLIEDYQQHRFGPPSIPVGFRLHAVTH